MSDLMCDRDTGLVTVDCLWDLDYWGALPR
jgi:hypothetical protein